MTVKFVPVESPTPFQKAELRADMERAAYEAYCSEKGVIAEPVESPAFKEG